MSTTIADFLEETNPGKFRMLTSGGFFGRGIRRGSRNITFASLSRKERRDYEKWKTNKELKTPTQNPFLGTLNLSAIPITPIKTFSLSTPILTDIDLSGISGLNLFPNLKPLTSPNKPVRIVNKIVEVKNIKPTPAFETFKKENLTSAEQLVTGPGLFEFILDFGNGKYYTTKRYKIKLETAERTGNPYFNIKTAPIIKLDGALLSQYSSRNKFRIGEIYAEVSVNKTITTPEEMMLHIDWLVSRGKEFRNTESNKSIQSNGRVYSGIGNWEVLHNPTGYYGFDYEDVFKKTQEDKAYAEQVFDGNISTNPVNFTLPTEVTSGGNYNNVQPTPPVNNEPAFPPFTTAGDPGERRTHEGFVYFWSPTQNKWRREDSLNLTDKERAAEYGNPDDYRNYQDELNRGNFSRDGNTGGGGGGRNDYDERERYLDDILGLENTL
jgi:hypothetical protein